MRDLPAGWVETTIDEVTLRTQQREPRSDEEFIYVDITSVDRESKIIREPKVLYGADAPSRARQIIHEGDVLVSMTRPNLNAVSLVPKELSGQIASTGFNVLRPDVVDPRWLYYLVRTKDFVDAMSSLVQGALYPAVRPKDIGNYPIPLAPLAEQKRIADKLDALLARVDACRRRLDRVPQLIKRFRQAVLAAATAGDLTADWREDSDIALTWTTVRAADICAKVQSGGTPKTGFIDTPGIPFLKVYNIVNQKVDFDYRPQYVSQDIHASELSKSKTLPGDVVMNIVGPPLGKVAIIPDTNLEWNINQAITLFRPTERITSKWIYFVLCDGKNVEDVILETRGIVGQVNISLSQCRNFEFPLPSIEEQHEIVKRVEALFAFADRLEARTAAARKQVDTLTPALLAKAFRGELVPQDPNDEPASALLERIRAERAGQGALFEATPKRRRKTPVKPA